MENELKRCEKCGEVTERILDFPLLDGSGRTIKKTVTVMCRCRREEMKEMEMRFEREERMRKMTTLRRLSLMDERMKGIDFTTYKQTEDNAKVFAIAKKYVSNFEQMKQKGQGIMFYGGVGTGKSYTAAAIANELLKSLRPVVMTSFIRLLEELRKFKDETADMYKDGLNSADLLVIDDFGAERGTDFALENVYDIIDSRYRSGKPIILTTNLDIATMRECTDIRYSRIYDRIFEMCYPVKTAGKSWRKKEAVSRFDEMKKLLEV